MLTTQINSLLSGNQAIGWGQNPTQPGTPGGGSGGAIYTDGDTYNLIINGTAIRYNSAREGGGGIFITKLAYRPLSAPPLEHLLSRKVSLVR